MHFRTGILTLVAVACVGTVRGQNQTTAQGTKPSAKELFLNPRQMPYFAQDEATPSAKPKAHRRHKSSPKPPATENASQDQSQPGQAVTAPAVPIIPASYSRVALALRYTLQETDKAGDPIRDVLPDTEFHSDDHIRLTLEVNDTGYLYVVHQGTSGKWQVLYPSPEIANHDNRVVRGQVYTVPPPGNVFTFSGKPGVEKLFVIFSRQRVDEIDNLIFSLQGGHEKEQPTGAPAPSAPAKESSPTLMAGLIDNDQIASMRQIYSRDLIIEKASQEQGEQQDKSVYVANPKGSADSRVVADISLIHK